MSKQRKEERKEKKNKDAEKTGHKAVEGANERRMAEVLCLRERGRRAWDVVMRGSGGFLRRNVEVHVSVQTRITSNLRFA